MIQYKTIIHNDKCKEILITYLLPGVVAWGTSITSASPAAILNAAIEVFFLNRELY